MVSGTFTDGGKEVDYSPFLGEVLAAGGHLTSLQSTGITIDGNEAAGQTVLTVADVDARLHLAAGQSVYDSSGVRRGVLASVDSNTQITLEVGLAAQWDDDDVIYVLGANKPSVTLISTSLDVSIDETNKLVIFECGNRSATSTTAAEDGRWWILGKR
tara:strand:- start:1306 stop:1779 length:474 start_codon:yes stop_codon:yes gene_type:complete